MASEDASKVFCQKFCNAIAPARCMAEFKQSATLIKFMKPKSRVRFALFAIVGLSVATVLKAATMWNGPAISAGDFNQPDQITTNVWITRGGSQGIYNAVSEIGFSHFFSPSNTEWADGTTANYNSLSYTDW